MTDDFIHLNDMPAVVGLAFRHFRGAADFAAMAHVAAQSAAADQIERAASAQDMAATYAQLANCDPAQDLLVAQIHGEMVGYWRAWWWTEVDGPGALSGPGARVFQAWGCLVPQWRGFGIGGSALRWLEARARVIAAAVEAQDGRRPMVFGQFTTQFETAQAQLLAGNGYEPVRYFHEMVRPSLTDIPPFPLPPGVALRPVLPAHYRAIWDASNEAMRDHWSMSAPIDAYYQAWLNDPILFTPHLWQIAWDEETNEVAGQVRAYVFDAQNEKFQRLRGYTEFISVRRAWRRRGLARALIAHSLRTQAALGLTESALGVDSENLSGATRLYQDCGFQVVKTGTAWRKGF
jgi:GNAT superfamily N-acetyltransferase